jgi:hypothetical protein
VGEIKKGSKPEFELVPEKIRVGNYWLTILEDGWKLGIRDC